MGGGREVGGIKSPGTFVHYLKQLLFSLSLWLLSWISKRQDFFYQAPLGETECAIRVSENFFPAFQAGSRSRGDGTSCNRESEKTLKCCSDLCWFKPHMSHCFRCLCIASNTTKYKIQRRKSQGAGYVNGREFIGAHPVKCHEPSQAVTVTSILPAHSAPHISDMAFFWFISDCSAQVRTHQAVKQKHCRSHF